MAQLEIKPTGMMLFRVFGIFFLALALAATLIYLLTGGGSELFEAWVSIYTLLPDATGVTPRTPVRLSGIQIGKVTGVRLSDRVDQQHAVVIEMSVKRRYLKNIPIDSRTDIGSDTLIGDKFIDINEGKSEAPLPDNGVLESEPLKKATERADLIRALADDLRQVDALLATASDPNTRLGQFIVGEAEYDGLLGRVTGFDRALRGILAPNSPIADIFFTNKLYDDVRSDAMRIDNTLDSIERAEGTAGRLFADDAAYLALTRRTRDLGEAMARLNSGQGKSAALLQSDAGYRKLADALKGINESLSRLNSGRGRAAELMRNPQLYESLNGALRSLADLLRDFEEHPEKYMRYKVFGKTKRK